MSARLAEGHLSHEVYGTLPLRSKRNSATIKVKYDMAGGIVDPLLCYVHQVYRCKCIKSACIKNADASTPDQRRFNRVSSCAQVQAEDCPSCVLTLSKETGRIMPKNKVLVLIDGSQFARQIFPQITRHLPPEYNELTLLCVEEEPHGHVGTPARPASPESKVMAYERRADLIEARHPIYASQEWESAAAATVRNMQEDVHLLRLAGYDVKPEVRFDRNPTDAIMRFIDTHHVDMIAMTTHGRAGLNRLMFGSMAQYLMSHVDIPIMIVRPRQETYDRED